METQTNFWSRNKTWIIVVGVIAIIFLYGVSKYNSFISQNEMITAQWAQVENQLQRRFDLIPNVIISVKGETAQEKAIFLGLAEARSKYLSASTPDARAQTAGAVESSMIKVLAIAESNPVLGSSGAFRDFRVQIEGTENRLAVERMKYNEFVRVFDTSVKRFPGSLFARVFGITERSYFEVKEEVRVNPKADFTN